MLRVLQRQGRSGRRHRLLTIGKGLGHPHPCATPSTFTKHALWLMLLLGPSTLPAGASELTPTSLSTPPSNLQLTDIHGVEHDLQHYAGKVVVVSFWTTWCPPCLREMPSLERLSRDMQNDGVVVLAVNVKEPRSRVKRFRRLPGDDVVVLLDTRGEQAGLWDVEVYPTAYVIGRHGDVALGVTGAIEWDDTDVRAALTSLAAESAH